MSQKELKMSDFDKRFDEARDSRAMYVDNVLKECSVADYAGVFCLGANWTKPALKAAYEALKESCDCGSAPSIELAYECVACEALAEIEKLLEGEK